MGMEGNGMVRYWKVTLPRHGPGPAGRGTVTTRQGPARDRRKDGAGIAPGTPG